MVVACADDEAVAAAIDAATSATVATPVMERRSRREDDAVSGCRARRLRHFVGRSVRGNHLRSSGHRHRRGHVAVVSTRMPTLVGDDHVRLTPEGIAEHHVQVIVQEAIAQLRGDRPRDQDDDLLFVAAPTQTSDVLGDRLNDRRVLGPEGRAAAPPGRPLFPLPLQLFDVRFGILGELRARRGRRSRSSISRELRRQRSAVSDESETIGTTTTASLASGGGGIAPMCRARLACR